MVDEPLEFVGNPGPAVHSDAETPVDSEKEMAADTPKSRQSMASWRKHFADLHCGHAGTLQSIAGRQHRSGRPTAVIGPAGLNVPVSS
jgi:hypothetical protein